MDIDLSKIFIDVKSLPQDGYGLIQLSFLGCVYGYLLMFASNMISDGSELLLLVPAWAGVVGSVILPVLGAVPDGCMVLFSGLGPNAQEQLNVGVGALAGSTIMVLIIPWYLSIVGGRVNIDPKTGKPSYKAPKLDPPNFFHLTQTGVAISPEVNQTAYLMLLTTLSYFLLQVPGLVYLNSTPAEQAAGEQNWALFGGILCVTFFSYYLYLQYKKSNADAGIQQDSRDEYLRTAIANKTVTLVGIMTIELEKYLEEGGRHRSLSNSSYQSGSSVTGATTEMAPLTRQSSSIEISDRFVERLKRVLKPFFASYDVDGNGCLKMQDLSAVFRDMGEQLTSEELDNNFAEFDSDHNGTIDYNEFVRGTAKYIATHKDVPRRYKQTRTHSMHNAHYKVLEEQPIEEEDEDEEEEEVPDDIKMLSPEEQQVQIKRRAFWMMAVGSAIVLLISDPMVEVLSEIGARTGIPSFYVAFVVAPLASNATELIAAYNYAQKKTATSITVSLTTLEGAAIMNNTFVLGVFMALIYFKGLVWEFFAETLAILLVELVMVYFALMKKHTIFDAYIILAMYPLSLAIVAGLEAAGWN